MANIDPFDYALWQAAGSPGTAGAGENFDFNGVIMSNGDYLDYDPSIYEGDFNYYPEFDYTSLLDQYNTPINPSDINPALDPMLEDLAAQGTTDPNSPNFGIIDPVTNPDSFFTDFYNTIFGSGNDGIPQQTGTAKNTTTPGGLGISSGGLGGSGGGGSAKPQTSSTAPFNINIGGSTSGTSSNLVLYLVLGFVVLLLVVSKGKLL